MSLRAWMLVGFVMIATVGQFWRQTIPVRFACTDDLAFQAVATDGNRDAYLVDAALAQGRFYFATPLYAPAMFGLYGIKSPALFAFVRAIAFFAQLLLLGWLAAGLLESPAAGAAVALLAAATFHLPATFYPVLSYPFNWVGMGAGLAALLLQQRYLRYGGSATRTMVAVLFLTACLMHEIFVLLLAPLVLLAWYGAPRSWSAQFRANFGPLGVASAYLAVYVAFALRFPSTYDGTRITFNLTAASGVIVRQVAGAMPGAELLINRGTEAPPPGLFRSGAAIAHLLRATPWSDYVLGTIQGATLTALLLHVRRFPSPASRRWPWLVALALLINLPIAFSGKYQVFIFHREFPYAYAFYSFLALCGAGVAGWIAAFGASQARPVSRGVAIGLCLLVVGTCLSARASTHHVLATLLHRFNS